MRWDGGHRGDRGLSEQLGRYVEWVPVCPEVELGLGVPREALRLEHGGGAVHLRGVWSRRDHSEAMRSWAERRIRGLIADGLAGYVLKARSPSCGLDGVPVWGAAGESGMRSGRGLFAAALLAADPQLIVEEAERLGTASAQRRFLERLLRGRESAADGGS